MATKQTNHPTSSESQGKASDGKSELRVLLAEDDHLIRLVCSKGLKAHGFSVVSVSDGASAWECLQTEHFDLVVTDHMMPKMTGLEFLRRIRAEGMRLPVVMISGRPPTHEPDFHALLQPGMILAKPFELQHLLDAVGCLIQPGR